MGYFSPVKEFDENTNTKTAGDGFLDNPNVDCQIHVVYACVINFYLCCDAGEFTREGTNPQWY